MAVRYIKLLFTLMFIIGLFTFGRPDTALAASANIEITINNDARPAVPYTGGEFYVWAYSLNSSYPDFEQHQYYDPETKKYIISGLTEDGDYIISVSDGKVSQEVKVVGYKKSLRSAKKVTVVWSENGGAIGGVTYDTDGITAMSWVGITVINSTGSITWNTRSSDDGSFMLKLPPGRYKLIVRGKMPHWEGDDVVRYKNSVYYLDVVKGQLSTPMETLKQVAWSENERELGLTFISPTSINDITNTTKVITGTVNKGSIINVYAYSPYIPYIVRNGNDEQVPNDGEVELVPNGEDQLILYGEDQLIPIREEKLIRGAIGRMYGESLIATAKSSAIDGKYKVTLKNVQPGKVLFFEVIDPAQNYSFISMYEPIPTLDPKLLKTDAEFGKAVTIIFEDPNKLMTMLTTVVSVNDSNETRTLDKTNYTLTPGLAGKLVIKAGVLDVGTYTVTLINSSFDSSNSKSSVSDLKVIQSTTTINAPALTVSAVAFTSGSAGDALLKVVPTSGNSIKYRILNYTIAPLPKIGEDANSIVGLTDLADDKVVSGLDIVNNKYLAVYETKPSGAIVKYKLLTLTAASIKVDTTTPSVQNVNIEENKIVTITFDDFVYKVGTTDLGNIKASIRIAKDGTNFTVLGTGDTAVISGKTIVVTLSTDLGTANKIKLIASGIQTKYGVKNKDIIINLN